MTRNNIIFYAFIILIGLSIDFAVEMSTKISKHKKMIYHLFVRSIIFAPMLGVLGTAATLINNVFGTVVMISILVAQVIMIIVSLVMFHRFKKCLHIEDINFLLDSANQLVRFMSEKFERESVGAGLDELRNLKSKLEAVLKYTMAISSMAKAYENAAENYEQEKMKELEEQFKQRKEYLNSVGIEIDENGEIRNVEKMLELICSE